MTFANFPEEKLHSSAFFCAGVPAYACIRAGATAQKSHCASNIFLREETLLKCPTLLRCSFGGNPLGACRSYEKNRYLQINFYFLLHFRKKVQKDLQISFFFCIFARKIVKPTRYAGMGECSGR